VVSGWQFVVTASIGVAVYPADCATADELVKCADTAMYCAKKRGGGAAFFDGVRKESASA
jgi:diguanylate cyclase (GGDEF)-like protein